MTTRTAYHPRKYGDLAFDNGVLHGISWHLTGDEEYRQPTSQLVVDFIRDNILEPNREGFLDENRLIDNMGFLVGWSTCVSNRKLGMSSTHEVVRWCGRIIARGSRAANVTRCL